jgi:hypothetical protein
VCVGVDVAVAVAVDVLVAVEVRVGVAVAVGIMEVPCAAPLIVSPRCPGGAPYRAA